MPSLSCALLLCSCCFTSVTVLVSFLFLNNTAPTQIYTLSLHDALPISDTQLFLVSVVKSCRKFEKLMAFSSIKEFFAQRSEEHTSELQSLRHLVCRLLLEKKKIK